MRSAGKQVISQDFAVGDTKDNFPTGIATKADSWWYCWLDWDGSWSNKNSPIFTMEARFCYCEQILSRRD